MKRTMNCLALAALALFVVRLAPAQTQPIDDLLDRAAGDVSSYLEKVSDVRCTETVRQLKLDKNGHTEYSEEGVYDYFVLLQGGSDELLLDESRIPKREARDRKDTPMLISNGFSMLYLIFHPYYRNSFTFEAAADDVITGRSYRRVHFSSVTGGRTPAALSVRGREYPLALVGNAWFDPQTGMLARIDATLNSDMHDIGLRSLHVQIDFAPVALPEWTKTYTFPTLAVVDFESLRQHWRNEHRFSDYKRFMVETQQTVSDKGLQKNE